MMAHRCSADVSSIDIHAKVAGCLIIGQAIETGPGTSRGITVSASATKSSVSTTLLSISAARKRKAQPSRQRDTRGDRYSLSGAYHPGVGVAGVARKASVETKLAAVADPMEPGKRIVASVNRRVDLLEYEHSHGNITVSQYEVGRQVQAIFERAAGARNTHDIDFADVRISDPSKRQDLADLAAIRAIDNAREVEALMRRVHLAIGETPAHFIRELLSRGGTVKDYVTARDPLAGAREITRVADRFRYLLEVLDDSFAACGAVVKDTDGNREIRAERGEATGEETDERGRVVRAGRGYRWGRVAVEQDSQG
jgi:hypothetical protein